MFRVRLDKQLLAKAKAVTAELGTNPGDIIRLCLTQLVKRQAIPFPVQVETPEDEVLTPIERRRAMLKELN